MTKLIKSLLFLIFILAGFTDPIKIYNDRILKYDKSTNLTITDLGVFKIVIEPNRAINRSKMYYLSGPVGINDCERISEKISYDSTIILNSPGGAYLEGLCIADTIKRRNVDTIVSNRPVFTQLGLPIWVPPKKVICASACTYMFLAGNDRFFIGDIKFGVHNPGLPPPVLFNVSPFQTQYSGMTSAWELIQALNRYDVKGDDLRELFFKVPNTTIQWITPKDFNDHPQYESIATTYIDFYGYNKEGKK